MEYWKTKILFSLLLKTIPGQSINLILLSKNISLLTVVKPGVLLTPATLSLVKLLIKLLLPTLG